MVSESCNWIISASFRLVQYEKALLDSRKSSAVFKSWLLNPQLASQWFQVRVIVIIRFCSYQGLHLVRLVKDHIDIGYRNKKLEWHYHLNNSLVLCCIVPCPIMHRWYPINVSATSSLTVIVTINANIPSPRRTIQSHDTSLPKYCFFAFTFLSWPKWRRKARNEQCRNYSAQESGSIGSSG